MRRLLIIVLIILLVVLIITIGVALFNLIHLIQSIQVDGGVGILEKLERMYTSIIELFIFIITVLIAGIILACVIGILARCNDFD